MSVEGLIDAAADMRPTAVAVLCAVAAFLVVLAAGVQLSVWRMRQELLRAEEELIDPATGLLPRGALRVRLGAEIAWAATTSTPLSVAMLRIRGPRFTDAARVLRDAMREEEAAFLLGDDRVVVELWDTEPEAAADATRRLGEHLRAAGHPVVDAGLGCSPRDGADVETLVAAAQRDLRPVDDPIAAGRDIGPDGRARGPFAQSLRLLVGALPAFVAAMLLLFTAWRLVPAAIDPVLGGDGSRDGSQRFYALLTALGLPIAAALLHHTLWNFFAGTAPRSRPLARAGWRVGAVIAAVVAVPLAWGVFAPLEPAAFADGFGASLAVIALIGFAVFHARQFVHLPAPLLVGGIALGAVIVWLAVETTSQPVVANVGRLLLAVSLGALLARSVERASWLVALAALAAAVDLWSVTAESGVTNRLLDAPQGGDGDRLVDLLLFTGPSIGGVASFAIGTTDLVFLALFMAWAHDWRLDLRLVACALLVGGWAAIFTGELLDQAVPLLPFLGGAMVLVLLWNSRALRRRSRTWSSGTDSDPVVPARAA